MPTHSVLIRVPATVGNFAGAKDAAAMALRLWGEHRVTAQLPPWEIVGLEVVDRPTYHKRIAEGYGEPPAFLGGVHPY